MLAPAIPADETTRLATLHALNILDSDSEERFDRITRLAKRLFGVPIALISLVDSDRQWFKSSVGIDIKESSRDTSFCGHAILGEDIFEVPDASLDERFKDNPLVTDSPDIRFYAGCPLTVTNGSKLGTLCLLDKKPRVFDEDDKALLRDLANMVELEVSAMQLASTDELTQLSNRRGFESLAGQALNVCKRLQKPASLLFFDLNKFKHINDEYGHAEGDKALVVFSDILLEIFRDSDVIGRLGGDEFVVFLTNTDQSQSKEALDRLQTRIDSLNQNWKRGYDLTFSEGAIEYQANSHASIAELIHEADQLMYAQKKSRPR